MGVENTAWAKNASERASAVAAKVFRGLRGLRVVFAAGNKSFAASTKKQKGSGAIGGVAEDRSSYANKRRMLDSPSLSTHSKEIGAKSAVSNIKAYAAKTRTAANALPTAEIVGGNRQVERVNIFEPIGISNNTRKYRKSEYFAKDISTEKASGMRAAKDVLLSVNSEKLAIVSTAEAKAERNARLATIAETNANTNARVAQGDGVIDRQHGRSSSTNNYRTTIAKTGKKFQGESAAINYGEVFSQGLLARKAASGEKNAGKRRANAAGDLKEGLLFRTEKTADYSVNSTQEASEGIASKMTATSGIATGGTRGIGLRLDSGRKGTMLKRRQWNVAEERIHHNIGASQVAKVASPKAIASNNTATNIEKELAGEMGASIEMVNAPQKMSEPRPKQELVNQVNVSGNNFYGSESIDVDRISDQIGRNLLREIEASGFGEFA